ncbi:SRPBCC domain-containing protein [Bacillus sonorensis]|uniref:SRPBCC family protein n=1 Tax=Bacillus TaxID=1386 RepID=UPI0004967929|nr:SRPBCC domain-containing protein [Bacillus sonorensis]MCF7617473.1 SRPBCC domain-containing protein [Bacillus sonorensis]MCY7856189.1 SRPBCC domain-containing protein [Bacillus sonorensis]MCY8035086.1 SRPBCC domain-containing protein [Bacillus sonorensis]MCY8089971.1 SRPBCC domain-containing protein [Bacillus sonorensis]MCY8269283.1 SRPBCC domain-containing protein [Bacillus sonorensis]
MTEQNNRVPDIHKRVTFDAPIQNVWKAVATSEGISVWFMPNDFQPEIGYEFTLQSPFGPSPCKVIELEAPHRLAFSWDTSGWVVTFELKETDGGKTEFTLIHSGWGEPEEINPKAGQSQSSVRDTMNNGWEAIVNKKLRQAVEN